MLKMKPVIFILLTSLVFRFWFSSTHVAFGQDVARDAYLTEQSISHGKYLAFYGPKASVGNFYLPPFYYQIHIFLSSLTNNHPLTMKWFVTLVESLTPVLIYLIAGRITNKKTAGFISLFYIFSCLPTIFGTSAWNPNTIPFLTSLMLHSLMRGVLDKKYLYISIAVTAASIAFQFHYQAFVLLPFLLLVFIYQMSQKDWRAIKYWILGGFISLLLISPYLYFEISHNFQNTKAIGSYFSQEHSQYFDRVSKPAYVLKFFPVFFEKVIFDFELPMHAVGNIVYFSGSILLLIYILKAYRQPSKNKDRALKLANYCFLLAFFISIAVMLRVYKGDKIEYYMSTLFLWPFILLTFMMDALRKNKKITWFIVAGLMVYSGWKLSFNTPFNQLQETKDVFSYLEEYSPSKSVRFLFHDDDHINTIAYGLTHFSSLSSDPHSLTVIDICNWHQSCVWDTTLQSKNDLAYSQVAYYKYLSGYQFLNRYTGDKPFKVVIGHVQNDLSLDTSSYLYQGEYGSDSLLKTE